MSFETNVFINCPFDDEYKRLLHPLLFTLLYYKLEPQISQTQSSAIIRINQIKNFIRESKFSIHDLSRSKPMNKNELPRFNMPYELGLDIGCVEFGGKKYSNKRILILETNRYHYQKVLSDIAGQDSENHDNDPAVLIIKVRNWLSTVDATRTYPSPSKTRILYDHFCTDVSDTLRNDGFTAGEIKGIPTADFIKFAKEWIANAEA